MIKVTQEIDTQTAQQFVRKLWEQEHGPCSHIIITVQSDGGDVYCLQTMLDAMEQCSKPMVTVGMGLVASAAAVVVAAGTPGLRFMAPRARMMLHDVNISMDGTMTAAEMQVEHAEMQEINSRALHFLAQVSGRPAGYFASMMQTHGHQDLYLSADECVKHGLVDHVYIPTMQVDVRVRCRLQLMDPTQEEDAAVARRAAEAARRKPVKRRRHK
jgi:ATP-dependent Clp protease protease subunit